MRLSSAALRSAWLDVLAIAIWGILLLKYWFSGKLSLLIHPNYMWLSVLGGWGLLGIAGWRTWQLWRSQGRGNDTTEEHVTLLPVGLGQSMLLVAAVLGLLVSPRPFGSQKALDRNVTDFSAITRAQPQTFQVSKPPEERSLLDWVRTLGAYPEPDAYIGQPIKVQGFIIHSPNLPEEYLVVARFIITCCAADAYPVGLPMQITGSRDAYPPDTWVEVEGEAIATELQGERQLAILARSLKEIPAPKNPYEY